MPSRAARRNRACRGVDQVNAFALVVEVKDAGVDGVLLLLFLVIVIGDAGAVIDTAAAIDRLGLEEQGVGQRGLAGDFMANESDAANVFHMITCHRCSQGNLMESLCRQAPGWAQQFPGGLPVGIMREVGLEIMLFSRKYRKNFTQLGQ